MVADKTLSNPMAKFNVFTEKFLCDGFNLLSQSAWSWLNVIDQIKAAFTL
jgi:hypothetical protein